MMKIAVLFEKRMFSRISALIILVSTLTVNFQPTLSLHAQDLQSTDAEKKVFLPIIVAAQEENAPRSPAIILSQQEAEVEQLLLNDPGQQHAVLTLNPTLVEQARRKAQDMADRVYFGHTDPDGYGPNYWVRQAGYRLPEFYSTAPNGNNIESIGAGYGDAQSLWNAWLASSGHRSHILGENDFYRGQYEYGIGYVYKTNGSFSHYWVILIAAPQ